MATVFDAAQYILEKQGGMTAMKLQKLVYYSQAWSLVWDGEPLFLDKIRAWANGPVVPRLYAFHRGLFKVDSSTFGDYGDSGELNKTQKETVDAVLKVYGDKAPGWLSELTHVEEPWKTAREGLSMGERGNTEISLAAMAEYYGSL